MKHVDVFFSVKVKWWEGSLTTTLLVQVQSAYSEGICIEAPSLAMTGHCSFEFWK